MSTTIHQEGSEILYRCCTAKQRTSYKLTTTRTGAVRQFNSGLTKTHIINIAKSKGKVLNVDYTLEGSIDPGPLEYVLGLIKNKLSYIQRQGSDLVVWLNDPEQPNFRYKLVEDSGLDVPAYKSGRPPKPEHYHAARQYMIDQWGAQLTPGYEEDDLLAQGLLDGHIASHIDKDINIVAGKHLNWCTKDRYIVKPGFGELRMQGKTLKGEGLVFFYAQLLMGDPCDAIQGVKGIGDAKAYALLSNAKSEAEAFGIVMGAYIKAYNEQGISYLKLMASLLWIVQVPGEYGEHYLYNRGLL